MRALLIGDYPPPHGGVAVHVAQLHARLRREGVDAGVLDIGKGREGRDQPGVEGAAGPADFAARLVRHARQGALLHLHTSGNNAKAWAVAASVGAVAAAFRTPAVVTLHSGLLPDLLERSPKLRSLAWAALQPYARIIAVSAPVAGAVHSLGFGRERLVTCPAFLPSEVQPGALPEGLEEKLEGRGPLLAYAHHPSPVYGRTVLFGALQRLVERHPGLCLLAFGPGTRAESFRSEARVCGIDRHVLPLGELDHPTALAVMQRASLFVRPTTADGDAVSVREALSLGLACVASDAAPRPEGTVTFRSGDAEALAGAVEQALELGPASSGQPDAGSTVLDLYRALWRRRAWRSPVGVARGWGKALGVGR